MYIHDKHGSLPQHEHPLLAGIREMPRPSAEQVLVTRFYGKNCCTLDSY
jgi:hypothetical protein